MHDTHITHMCITTPNLDKMRRNLPIVLPHVDEAVIVIGRRCEETIKYLKRFPQVKIIYHPWRDSFRDQYQVGLNNITGGWVNIMDDDEVPSEGMLKNFRSLVEQSQNGNAFDVVEFCAVEARENGEFHKTEYYRQMFYKWNPNLRYHISLHQSLAGLRRAVRCEEVYYHHKTEEGSMRGSCRNFFAAGVWADAKESFEYWHKLTGEDPRTNRGAPLVPQPQGQAYPLQDGFRIDSWHEMKDIVARNHPEVQYFHQLDPLIQSGEVCQEFVEWAERHNEKNDTRPHVHEIHKFDMYIKHWSEKRRNNA